MQLMPLARRALAIALDALYPQACGGCGRFGAGLWCAECAARTPMLTLDQARGAITLANGRQVLVLSAFLFRAPLNHAIHAFKYRATPQLADAFTPALAALWRASGLHADAYVPVPLHPSRARERGYNQSGWLAQRLSRAGDVPLRAAALRRIRRTRQQAGLAPADRLLNAHQAFDAPRRLDGLTLALVDDVLTTGATLAACADACFNAGAKEVIGLTLARSTADHHSQ